METSPRPPALQAYCNTSCTHIPKGPSAMGKVRAVRRARSESLTSIMRQSDGLVRDSLHKEVCIGEFHRTLLTILKHILVEQAPHAGFENFLSFPQSFRVFTLAPGNLKPSLTPIVLNLQDIFGRLHFWILLV